MTLILHTHREMCHITGQGTKGIAAVVFRKKHILLNNLTPLKVPTVHRRKTGGFEMKEQTAYFIKIKFVKI
jgi:hypothetical protein